MNSICKVLMLVDPLDSSLLVKKESDKIVVVLMYADNLIIDETEIRRTKENLLSDFS